jgi:hypothetical protein
VPNVLANGRFVKFPRGFAACGGTGKIAANGYWYVSFRMARAVRAPAL